jgi:hypothetical protein
VSNWVAGVGRPSANKVQEVACLFGEDPARIRMLIERDLIDREFMELMMPHSDDLLATFATLQPGDAEPEGGENPHG